MTQSPTSPELTPEEEALIDAALKEARMLETSEALKRTLLEDFDDFHRRKRQASAAFGGLEKMFGRFRYAAAGAFASIAAFGAVTGVITANVSTALSPEEELYLYAEDILPDALLDEEGVG